METKKHQITIDKHIDLEEQTFTDANFLTIVVKHLISNAISYTDLDKGYRRITISVHANSQTLVIHIADNGIGIKEEDHQKVFHPFYRGALQPKHHGLGLFIVKSLVLKLKGKVALNSVEGNGTAIEIEIPNHCCQ
jgi:signal transduction histidine kinase